MSFLRLTTLSTGDEVHCFHRNIVIPFKGKRKVLSTSVLNGGYQENLEGIFNNDCNPGSGMSAELKAPTYEEHMALVAKEMGLDPTKAAGLCTAASMKNVAIVKDSFAGLEVTALVTAGVKSNGGRVGDPAAYIDWHGAKERETLGTINTILIINANLPPETMVRALITATEAKAAALQELMASSCYSTGIATGSGTDGTIIVSNADADLVSRNAGKHNKLGELIGKTVQTALKEALAKQDGLTPQAQHSVFARLKRYGLQEEDVWQSYQLAGLLPKAQFFQHLFLLEGKPGLLPLTVQLIHLLDELNWGLLDSQEVAAAGTKILVDMGEILGVLVPQLPQIQEGSVQVSLLNGLKSLFVQVE